MLKKTPFITDSSRNIFLFVWTDLVQFLVQFFSKLGSDPVNGGPIMGFFFWSSDPDPVFWGGRIRDRYLSVSEKNHIRDGTYNKFSGCGSSGI